VDIKMKKVSFKLVENIVYSVVLFALFLLASVFILSRYKTPLNIMAFSVQSGSMEPSIKTGSIVFVHLEKEYRVGDVVTFRSPKSIKDTFTHRIVRIEKDADINKLLYYTKGDANEDEDNEPLDPGLVLGKVVFTIPFLGYPLAFAKTQMGFVALIIIPATIIVYSELIKIKDEVVKSITKRKDEKNKLN
jgi:signal peptidase